MSQKEFNNHLDQYLSSKIKKVKKPIFKKKTKKVSEVYPSLESNSIHIIKKEEPLFKRLLMRTKPNEEEFESEEQEIEEEIESSPSFFTKLKSIFSVEKEELEESVDEPELEALEEEERHLLNSLNNLSEKRKEALEKIIAYYSNPDRLDAVEKGEFESLENDLKQIAKFTAKVLNMLPKRKLDEIKESDQLEIFKKILKKRKLIKT